MTDTLELTDILLRLIGAFYVFAGFVATRAGLTSYFIDRAIAAISCQRPSRAERMQAAWLLAASALVLAGGVLLLAGLELAAWVFLASAAGQAAYIFFIAPRFFDREDPPNPRGRRQTTNAFVIFLAATAFILWADQRGRLTTLDEATGVQLVGALVAIAIYAGYVTRLLLPSPRAAGGGLGANASASEGDAPPRALHTSKRVKLMAECGCDPLWALDDDLFGCFAADALGLSQDLTAAIDAWAARFEGSMSLDDPEKTLWSDEEHALHEAEGRRLAERVKQERPDLVVYVNDPDGGIVEVNA